jgi:hypothetical protein
MRSKNIRYCSTDFYVESTPDQHLGFLPGVVEELVIGALRKWKNVTEGEPAVKTERPPNVEEVSIAKAKKAGNDKSEFANGSEKVT